MRTPTSRKKAIDQLYVGHKIQLNWTLILILAWLSFISFSFITKIGHPEDQCTDFSSYFQLGDDE